MPFPCTGCGSCCRRVDKLLAHNVAAGDPDSPLFFPYKHDKGKCENLLPDNKCSVYEERPLVCNIDALMKVMEIPEKLFYSMNIFSCNQFMDEDGIPLKFRIPQ